MSFPEKAASDLLARCHRRCCICHRFCGVKMELDHIIPKDDGGADEIENAIPVCFECHAEIHSYNDRHPRGRKFRPAELRQHKELWLKALKSAPLALTPAAGREDVGPLQGLVDELEFNLEVAVNRDLNEAGCAFLVGQFERAIAAGSVAVLTPSLKDALIAAYRVLIKANVVIPAVAKGFSTQEVNRTRPLLEKAEPAIRHAQSELRGSLGGRIGGD